MDYITSLLFLCPIMFLASFVDAISGGGGLLSLPAYLFTGMPVHNAYACNKLCCNISAAMSAGRYLKNNLIDKKAAFFVGAVTFCCSVLASKIVLWMPDRALSLMLLGSMPFVAILILVNKKYPKEDHSDEVTGNRKIGLWIFTGIAMGAYDGMLGPGSGTLAIIIYTKLLKYDLTRASGNAKVAVFSSTLAGTISYLLAGKILWNYALPVAICGVLGGYAGSGMAIRKGARFIRPMMLVIAAVLIVKLIFEML